MGTLEKYLNDKVQERKQEIANFWAKIIWFVYLFSQGLLAVLQATGTINIGWWLALSPTFLFLLVFITLLVITVIQARKKQLL